MTNPRVKVRPEARVSDDRQFVLVDVPRGYSLFLTEVLCLETMAETWSTHYRPTEFSVLSLSIRRRQVKVRIKPDVSPYRARVNLEAVANDAEVREMAKLIMHAFVIEVRSLPQRLRIRLRAKVTTLVALRTKIGRSLLHPDYH